ncbi:MAG: secondary thiamine-phosphate synthase enzyme YjbQ [Actinomycetota bacterium]
MKSTTVTLNTGRTRTVVDITHHAAEFVGGEGDGLLNVFVPHATAGVAIIETRSGTEDDLLNSIERLLPVDDAFYRHRHGAEGHGGDHVLPAWISPSTVVPVIDGRLALGTWQSIVLVDPNKDNPTRTIRFSLLPSS